MDTGAKVTGISAGMETQLLPKSPKTSKNDNRNPSFKNHNSLVKIRNESLSSAVSLFVSKDSY